MLEVPPPGPGLLTVTLAVVAVAMSVAGIAAVNRVPLTKVVVRALPFHNTVEPATKPAPLTVRVNADPPGAAADGTRGWSMNGTGLLLARTAKALNSVAKVCSTTRRRILIWGLLYDSL